MLKEPKKQLKKAPDPKIAKAGEQLSARAVSHMKANWPRTFKRELTTKEAITIKPKSDTKQGQWFCADCGHAFQNNLQVWAHSNSHRRVWWTGEHFEEP
jgi:hypothetical protein